MAFILSLDLNIETQINARAAPRMLINSLFSPFPSHIKFYLVQGRLAGHCLKPKLKSLV
jgi:hypothetical protein